MRDKTKTPYENMLAHAGFDVQRRKEDGTLALKPNTKFISSGILLDEWDFEPDLGNYKIYASMRNTTQNGQELTMELIGSPHTRHSVEISHVSRASDWYAFENEEVRLAIQQGDHIKMKAWVSVSDGKKTYMILDGTFVTPPPEKYDFLGSRGIFLLDPVNCHWSVFLDVIDILYDKTSSPPACQTTIVSMGLHSRLEYE